MLFESGCLPSTVCQLLNGPVKRLDRTSRDFVSCTQCCSTDICNDKLCLNPGTSASTALQCYSCKDPLKPEHCTELTTCGSDYECQTMQYVQSSINEIRYQLRCMRKSACRAIETMTSDYCAQCCNTSYCNTALCGFLSKSLPLTTSYLQDKVVAIGDVISIQCLVYNVPSLPFTVTWKHETGNHVVTSPSVSYSHGNQTVRMKITRDHYGYWTCTVKNKNGAISKTAKVVPPAPSPG